MRLYKTLSVGDRVRLSSQCSTGWNVTIHHEYKRRTVFEIGAVILDWRGELFYHLISNGVYLGSKETGLKKGWNFLPNILEGKCIIPVEDQEIIVSDEVELIENFQDSSFVLGEKFRVRRTTSTTALIGFSKNYRYIPFDCLKRLK